MLSFNKLNNITGWFAFLISLIVYTLTVEPTASFWDCGEFISVSYKLMVPHPPGAPFYLMVGRVFSLLAFGDVMQVAFWVNMLSVISSALTVLFTFWAITLLGRKLINLDELGDFGNYLLMAAGLVGSLALTFSDTFWFSAGEAEVYAMSSFFTAFAFWAILKWELFEDQAAANRWLIMIAYTMGLSTGVHLLNLLTIPALGLVIYFKYYKPDLKGILITLAISASIILVVLEIIIKGLPTIASKIEIVFVNSFGAPFGSGVIFFVLLFIGALVYGIYYSIKKNNAVLNTAILAFIFVILGFASYGVVAIRSNYNPPINENAPDDVISFLKYLKREQYGDRPLFKGPIYSADPVGTKTVGDLYHKTENGYEIYDQKLEQEFNPRDEMLFCRVADRRPDRVRAYENWMNLRKGERPNMSDNIGFLFKYQLGHMYWRYFMWNFAGRQNDIQGHGGKMHGNWVSGISFIDKARLGDLSKLPDDIKSNKANNNYFFLPLILGLLGLVFQYKKGRKDFSVVALLFFFTGIAIILYLNQPPVEPRERDYTSAGSFYAFCIWIGLGVIALYDLARNYIKDKKLAIALSFAVSMIIPGIMAAENWDDHDRSDRYHSVDQARNLLASCAPNAILFTGGDNDTFPLWYVQEVEGFRTDVRVCVLSYFSIDWYIDQMKRRVYESEPFPITFTTDQYLSGINDYLQVVKDPKWENRPLNVDKLLDAIKNEDPLVSRRFPNGSKINILPGKQLGMRVNTEAFKSSSLDVESAGTKNNWVPAEWRNEIEDIMRWNIKGGHILKADLMILDIINNVNKNGWDRPVYFNATSLITTKLDLRNYIMLEGLAYRLLPVKTPKQANGRVNTEVMYDNLMNKFAFRSMDNPDIYYNEEYLKFAMNARQSYYRLAETLYSEGDTSRAKEVINYCWERLPGEVFPYSVYSAQFLPLFFELGLEQAEENAIAMGDRAIQYLDYMYSEKVKDNQEIQTNMYMLNIVSRTLNDNVGKEAAEKYRNAMQQFSSINI